MAARDAWISIAVYRVDPATGRRRTVRRRRNYRGDDSEVHAMTTRWPACRCPRCGGAGSVSDGRPPPDGRRTAAAALALTALTVLLGSVAVWLRLY